MITGFHKHALLAYLNAKLAQIQPNAHPAKVLCSDIWPPINCAFVSISILTWQELVRSVTIIVQLAQEVELV